MKIDLTLVFGCDGPGMRFLVILFPDATVAWQFITIYHIKNCCSPNKDLIILTMRVKVMSVEVRKFKVHG